MIQRKTKWRAKTCVSRGQLRPLGKIFRCKCWDRVLLRSLPLCILKQFQKNIIAIQLSASFLSYLFWLDATSPVIHSSTFVDKLDGAIDIDYFRFL